MTDLLLEFNQTTFQIDCLIITSSTIHLIEVKNYEGDFYFEGNKFFKRPRTEMINPLHQLGQTQALLRQLLLSLGYNTSIEASVVFVNPAFTLYQAPLDLPIIFPTQINHFLKLVRNQSQARLSGQARQLARRLVESKQSVSRFQTLPTVNFEDLKKGITCKECGSFSVKVVKRKCVCGVCNFKESVTEAVLRTIEEYKILFPDRRLTTKEIREWCKIVDSWFTIRRILSQNYKAVSSGRWTYYV